MTTVDPTAWDPVLADARAHAARGDNRPASHLLAELLRELDPATTEPDHQVLAVAALYLTVSEPDTDDLGERPDEVAWARHAVQTARTLYGVYHPNTIDVTELLASHLSDRGHDREADQVRQQLIALHIERGAVSESFWARLELAWQWHGRGQCRDAHRGAEQIWQEWTARFGDTGRLSALIALQVSGMLRACGRTAEAHPYLDIADRPIPARDDPRRDAYATYLLAFCVAAIDHQLTCAFTHDDLPSSTSRTAEDTVHANVSGSPGDAG
ncbi:hypothetical protein [Dactylosporangium sp. CA-139066]|uniref:hypothetical protein n=1 Tax=Dactylosporangium sp. CA-139066 TaxID=3239930 RepID=UPI003D9256BF